MRTTEQILEENNIYACDFPKNGIYEQIKEAMEQYSKEMLYNYVKQRFYNNIDMIKASKASKDLENVLLIIKNLPNDADLGNNIRSYFIK